MLVRKKLGYFIVDKFHCNKKDSYCRGDYQFSKVANLMSGQLDA